MDVPVPLPTPTPPAQPLPDPLAASPDPVAIPPDPLALTPLVQSRLAQWREHLIDLSRNNPMISLKLARRRELALLRPEPLSILDRLLRQKLSLSFRASDSEVAEPGSLFVPPTPASPATPELPSLDEPATSPEAEAVEHAEALPDLPEPATRAKNGEARKKATRLRADEILPEELDGRELKRRLDRLYQQARDDRLQRGLHSLYLVCGILEWHEEEGETSRSPVLILAVGLESTSASNPRRLRAASEDLRINPALVARLMRDFQYVFPPLPENPAEPGALSAWFDLLKASTVGQDGWKLEKVAQLAILSFDKSVIHEDLKFNEARIGRSSLIRAMAGETLGVELVSRELPSESQLDSIEHPADCFTVLDADGSQRLAMEAARRGRSFVLIGPPGTGKSQTITNLIADRLSRGGRVLFVAEKMAALDVVHRRLEGVGLADFCLELHSPLVSRKRVVEQLHQSLVGSLDAPDEAFDFDRLASRRQVLNRAVDALHRQRLPLNLTIWQAAGEVALFSALAMPPWTLQDPASRTADWLDAAMQAMQRLTRVARTIREDSECIWWGYRADGAFSLEHRERVRDALDRGIKLTAHLQQLLEQAREFLGVGTEENLLKLGDLLERNPSPPIAWLREPEKLPTIRGDIDRLLDLQGCIVRNREVFNTRYGVHFTSLPSGLARSFEAAWNAITPLLHADPAGTHVHKRRDALSDWLVRTPDNLREWEGDFRAATVGLGIAFEPLTVRRLTMLLELAAILSESPRPEADWLQNNIHDRVGRLLQALRDDPERLSLREGLLKSYDERLFLLDLDRLSQQFSTTPGLLRRYLSPGWKRDRDALRNVHRQSDIPAGYRHDLLTAREVSRREERLRAAHGDAIGFLGAWSMAFQSGVMLRDAAAAHNRAGRIRELLRDLGCAATPKEVTEACRNGLPLDLAGVVQRLRQSVGAHRDLTASLANVLPLAMLPPTRIPWEAADPTQVRDYLARLSAAWKPLEIILREVGTGGGGIAEILDDVRQNELLRAWLSAADADRDYNRHRFGDDWKGLETTDWATLATSAKWADELRGLFVSGMIPNVVVDWIFKRQSDLPKMEEVRAARAELSGIEAEVSRWFDPIPARLHADPSKFFAELNTHIDELVHWFDWRDLPQELRRLDLTPLSDWLRVSKSDPSEYVHLFRKSFLTMWIDSQARLDPDIADFRGDEHEQVIADFRRLDEEYLKLNGRRLRHRLAAARPRDTQPTAGSETELLLKQALAGSRQKPLRELFEGMPGLLQALRPCLMMSPTTVAQFLLHSKAHFDLVIFDEASQIPAEDSLGAIGRGSQVVIVGDDKQLPPTSFFQTAKDSPALAETETYRSILDQSRTILPSLMLRWHYRSKDESLIAFSNREFYDSRLVTFPAAGSPGETRGVFFHLVPDGVYDRGGRRDNRREAEVIAGLVFDQLARDATRTVGIIAFSQAQMLAIEDQLEKRRRADARYEDYFRDDLTEPIFVRNLETVQGDERDVIFLSLGYGKDSTGKPLLNFGPVNKPGGEKRLNVAITRAREKLVLISSLTSADLQSKHSNSEGMRQLRRYLTFAETNREPKATSLQSGLLKLPTAMPAHPLVVDIRREIKQMGWMATSDFAIDSRQIDLAVSDRKKPEVLLLGILLDGTSYRDASTATDRYRLRPRVLGELGWKLHRVHVLDWIRNRAGEIERMRKVLEGLRGGGRRKG